VTAYASPCDHGGAFDGFLPAPTGKCKAVAVRLNHSSSGVRSCPIRHQTWITPPAHATARPRPQQEGRGGLRSRQGAAASIWPFVVLNRVPGLPGRSSAWTCCRRRARVRRRRRAVVEVRRSRPSYIAQPLRRLALGIRLPDLSRGHRDSAWRQQGAPRAGKARSEPESRAQRFIEGRNEPEDIAGMIRLFRWFRNVCVHVQGDRYLD
jgi:hypothetical protein